MVARPTSFVVMSVVRAKECLDATLLSPRSGGSGVLHTSCGRAAVIAVRRGAVSATASVAKWVASPFLNSELTAHTLYNLLCS